MAYAADLVHFRAFAGAADLRNYAAPAVADLGRYVVFLNAKGLGASTVRRHVNSLRTFYRFLEVEGRGAADAALLMEPPKVWKRLPRPLSLPTQRPNPPALHELPPRPSLGSVASYFKNPPLMQA